MADTNNSKATEVDDLLTALENQDSLIQMAERYDIAAGDFELCNDLHKAISECENSVKAARSRYMRRMAELSRKKSNRNVE